MHSAGEIYSKCTRARAHYHRGFAIVQAYANFFFTFASFTLRACMCLECKVCSSAIDHALISYAEIRQILPAHTHERTQFQFVMGWAGQ